MHLNTTQFPEKVMKSWQVIKKRVWLTLTSNENSTKTICCIFVNICLYRGICLQDNAEPQQKSEHSGQTSPWSGPIPHGNMPAETSDCRAPEVTGQARKGKNSTLKTPTIRVLPSQRVVTRKQWSSTLVNILLSQFVCCHHQIHDSQQINTLFI